METNAKINAFDLRFIAVAISIFAVSMLGALMTPAVAGATYDEEIPRIQPVLGSISVCKAIVDGNGNVVDGTGVSGEFELSGLNFNDSVGVLPTSQFSTTLSFNTNVFEGVDGDDAQCVTYDELALGSYYYGEEVITGDNWLTPRYNDQHVYAVEDIYDFYAYSGELFTEDTSDDSTRNTNADGHIVLTNERPDRTLVVLNQFEEVETPYSPYCGDGVVNQSWEQCDGGLECSAQCQTGNQCVELALARVNVDETENWGSGDVTSDVFLGAADNKIPQGVWFLIAQNGIPVVDTDMTSGGYENVPGISVERQDGSVRTLLHGSHARAEDNNKEHADGNLEFWGANAINQINDASGNNKVEKAFDGNVSLSAGQDEIWFEDDNILQSFFWLTVTVADDGFFTSYEDTSECSTELIASKVMCESESLLPNWGAGGADITSTTATDYVEQTEGCTLEKDWSFQYGDQSVSNPGDNLGEATEGWTTFGPTNGSGVAEVTIADASDISRLWVREVFQSGFVPFTHASSKSDISAEMYCHTDVLNYDNYDYINNPVAGETYYCVAFNAPESIEPPVVDNSCPFEAAEGRIIIDFEDGDKIRSDNGDNTSGPVGTTVPEGTYKVSLASYDGYENRSNSNQPEEVWKLLLNKGETLMAHSNRSTDLQDGVDYVARTDEVNGELYVPHVIDNAVALHGSDNTSNANSVEPVCAALDVVLPNQKPVITLRGDNPVMLYVGENYNEAGADVDDAEDGDIDYKLVIDGTANTDVANTYIVTYNATDTENLAADEVTRQVIVRNIPDDPKQCEDGFDNDNDNLIDSADPGCHSDGNPDNPDSYEPKDDDETHEIAYAPYCGDGEVNQEWESCDGGEQCTDQCQLDNQCVERAFARVNTDDVKNWSNGDASSDVFLGSSTNKIPGSAWFIIYDNGNYITDPFLVHYEDVPGLAVQRFAGNVRTLLHGSHPHDGSKEFVTGNVELFNVDLVTILDDTAGNNKLENANNGIMDELPGEDEVWTLPGNTSQAFFWLTVTTADDGFYANYGDDVPMCEVPENEQPVITLIGDNPLIINLFGTYSNPGATALDYEDGDLTDDIVVGGDTVDTNTEGTYFVTYDVVDSEGLAAETATRTVSVIDDSDPTECSDNADNDSDSTFDETDPGCWTDPTDPETYDPNDNSENEIPVITLRGNSVIDVMQGTSYTEELADVDDTEDGDIDGNLVVGGDVVDTNATGTYTITYNAQDSLGASAVEVTRTVNVLEDVTTECSDQIDNDEDGLIDADDAGCWTDPSDPESYDPNDNDENNKPVITRIGSGDITIDRGTTYSDEGATADDAEDGDITSSLVTTGSVDSSNVGVYTIRYNVTDSDSLAADEVIRTVRVKDPSSNPVCTTNCGGGGGGGHIPNNLRIFNETITIIGEGTALITWETNKPADSRVVYDDDSQPVDVSTYTFGLGAMDLGYEFTTDTAPALTLEHSMLVTNVNLEDLFYFRPLSSDGTRAIGIELSAVLGQVTGGTCEQLLFEFIRFGANNNPSEVIKLQTFLNEYEGNNLVVNGVYDLATFNAVVSFQNKYQGDILSPWGLQSDTGYVYLTTRKKINEIYCNFKLPFPLTSEQQEEVNAFKALLEQLEATGQPLPDTSNVGLVPTAPSFAEGGTPNTSLTEETTSGVGGLATDEDGQEEGDDSLAAAIEAVEGEGQGIFSRIGNFIKGIFR